MLSNYSRIRIEYNYNYDSQQAQNDEIDMADACVQTHSSQAGDNLDTDELEVQTASAALNLTDDAMCQEEADSDCDRDCDIDDVDDALFF